MGEWGLTKISMHHPVGKFTITFYSYAPAEIPDFSLNWKYVKRALSGSNVLSFDLKHEDKILCTWPSKLISQNKIPFQTWMEFKCFKDAKG